MEAIRRPLGWLLVAISVVIGVQYVFQAAYDSGDVWFILDFAILVGAVISLIVNYMRKRAFDSGDDGGFSREYFESNVLLYASTALIMMFLYNWINLLVNGDDASDASDYLIIWTVVDVSVVIVSCVTGRYLLRGE